jgi:hypothetical protein
VNRYFDALGLISLLLMMGIPDWLSRRSKWSTSDWFLFSSFLALLVLVSAFWFLIHPLGQRIVIAWIFGSITLLWLIVLFVRSKIQK